MDREKEMGGFESKIGMATGGTSPSWSEENQLESTSTVLKEIFLDTRHLKSHGLNPNNNLNAARAGLIRPRVPGLGNFEQKPVGQGDQY
jgi:hypothetical protein